MDLEILQNLGFTPAEAKVYLTLLKIGPVKVGKIIEKSGLQSSTIHNTLSSLIEKGFINYIFKGKIKVYQAVEPKILLKEFREREHKFEAIVPELELAQQLAQEKQQAEIYEGVKGVIAMLNEFIEDSRPGDKFNFFAVDVEGSNLEIQKFFERYDLKRKDKKLMVRGLARRELKHLFENRKYLKMRYVDWPIPSNVSTCGDKMALITWGDKPTGVLIKSKQLVESQVKFFESLWKAASS